MCVQPTTGCATAESFLVWAASALTRRPSYPSPAKCVLNPKPQTLNRIHAQRGGCFTTTPHARKPLKPAKHALIDMT
jgi:hypothetical protein